MVRYFWPSLDMKQRMDALEEKFDADEQRLSAERDARIAGEIDQRHYTNWGAAGAGHTGPCA